MGKGTSSFSPDSRVLGVPTGLDRMHSTVSLQAGHFMTYACSPYDNQWRCFSDSAVTPIETVLDSENAYILFYRRECVPYTPPTAIRTDLQVNTLLDVE